MARNVIRGWAAALAVPVVLMAASRALQSQTAGPPMSATLVCRPALANEAASAKMVASATLLVCRPLAISMRMSDGSMKTIGSAAVKPQPGPDFSKALTAEQINEAYNRWVERTLHIDPAVAHSP
jgi:hypothetical protein